MSNDPEALERAYCGTYSLLSCFSSSLFFLSCLHNDLGALIIRQHLGRVSKLTRSSLLHLRVYDNYLRL